MTVGFAFILGVTVGRIAADVAEWLRNRRRGDISVAFAKGYLKGRDSVGENQEAQ